MRELYGVMAARGATGGFVVTSRRVTDDAIGIASGRNVTLVDGPKLIGFIRQARAGARKPATRADAKATRPDADSGQATVCPLCTSRWCAEPQSAAGANAGGEFLGCTSYPACRGTRPID